MRNLSKPSEIPNFGAANANNKLDCCLLSRDKIVFRQMYLSISEVQPTFDVAKGTKNLSKREQKKVYFRLPSVKILYNKREKYQTCLNRTISNGLE